MEDYFKGASSAVFTSRLNAFDPVAKEPAQKLFGEMILENQNLVLDAKGSFLQESKDDQNELEEDLPLEVPPDLGLDFAHPLVSQMLADEDNSSRPPKDTYFDRNARLNSEAMTLYDIT